MNADRSWLRLEVWAQLALVAVTLALATAGAGSVLNLVFLPLSVAVALFLYQRSPTRDYISFCLWIWMLAPLVRRLADWNSGFNTLSLIIIAPFAVSLLVVMRADRKLFWSYAPFSMFIVVYLYGLLLGLFQGQWFAAPYTFVTMISPVLFGCFILTYPKQIGEVADVICRTLVQGSLVLAAYGIDQYFNLRDWDKYWMISSQMASIGLPIPQAFRLYGTLNSPGPFAQMLAVGLLAMFASSSRLRWIAAPLAVTVLALTLVRSTWFGLAVGLLVLVVVGQGKQRFRYVLIGLSAALLAVPLLSYAPISEVVLRRLDTIGNLSADSSYNARLRFTDSILDKTDTLILGNGLGMSGLGAKFDAKGSESTVSFDNGLLEIFFNFGSVGVLIILSLASMVYFMLRAASTDRYVGVATAVALCTLSQIIFSNSLNGVSGMFFFPFVAIVVCQRKLAARRPDLYAIQRAFAR